MYPLMCVEVTVTLIPRIEIAEIKYICIHNYDSIQTYSS